MLWQKITSVIKSALINIGKLLTVAGLLGFFFGLTIQPIEYGFIVSCISILCFAAGLGIIYFVGDFR